MTVLIGIAHKNQPVGGVIHQPYYNYKKNDGGLGRTLWGIPGVGVGGFKPIAPPEGKRLVVTTRSHMTPVVQQALEALKPDEILRVGGAGFKVIQNESQVKIPLYNYCNLSIATGNAVDGRPGFCLRFCKPRVQKVGHLRS